MRWFTARVFANDKISRGRRGLQNVVLGENNGETEDSHSGNRGPAGFFGRCRHRCKVSSRCRGELENAEAGVWQTTGWATGGVVRSQQPARSASRDQQLRSHACIVESAGSPWKTRGRGAGLREGCGIRERQSLLRRDRWALRESHRSRKVCARRHNLYARKK